MLRFVLEDRASSLAIEMTLRDKNL